MTWETIATVLAAIGGGAGLGALYRELAYRRAHQAKATAEADHARVDVQAAEFDVADRVADTALKLLEPFKASVAHLERRVEHLTTDLAAAHTELAANRTELTAARNELIAARDTVRKLGAYITVLIQHLQHAELPVPSPPEE